MKYNHNKERKTMKIMVAEIYDGYNKDSTYVLVYKNPQSQEVSELGNYFRGIIDESGNVYAWNKQEFIHSDAQKQFNISTGFIYYLDIQSFINSK
jgi:hypothetical protein